MITKIELKGFKSYVDYTFELKPLTILTGLNSSGKSSVIQAIRIMDNMSSRENGGSHVWNLGLGSDSELINPNCKNFQISAWKNHRHEEAWFSYNSSKSRNKLWPMPSCIYVAADRMGATSTIPIYEDEALGGRGENVLRRIDYFRDEQLPELLRGDAEGTTLNYVLRYWLQKISPGVKFDYRIEEKADVSYSLYDNHRSANVGYGLSYSLPVIVALLTSTLETGSIVLIENPEAHLHPQGQAEMARLICLCVEAGAQVVVETHSDHLFDGVRIYARESENHFASKVATFWCQLDDSRNTQVDRCQIQENGRLDHWPEHMFDQFLLDSEKLL
ncbi:DUF3696 domain-containing protein [Prevotella copri]|uniref:DUF3696 domain-containing protein n=1 Tax=Segatella copri TaxID=165179 RepID=A0AAW5UBV8_9BACT|nr:DUF3696 domain-containing protein [Segatella copri]MCW4100176.1 DUF3696 domain-containing protein [Segatella copri]MCW4133017.1 DUF3696 domain-containing protein [Segatella copri]MCW4163572.1 DUF3696 domain-containing protein [Segatella copri]